MIKSGVSLLLKSGVSLPLLIPPEFAFDNLEFGLRILSEGTGIEEIDLFPSKDSLGLLAMLLPRLALFVVGEADEGPILDPNLEDGLGMAEFSAAFLFVRVDRIRF